MKNEIIKIAKKGTVTTEQARTPLLVYLVLANVVLTSFIESTDQMLSTSTVY